MRLFRTPDPVDIVLGDETTDGDLADVAATVHELRSTYLPTESPARSEALTAFTSVGAHGVARSESSERTIPMRKTLAAFAATITGKVVLGTAVAAASVGGAAAAGVNVPVLPDNAEAVVETAERAELPENADQGQATAEAAHENEGDGPADEAFGAAAEGEVPDDVRSFLLTVETWVDCVRDATAAQAEDNDPEFDLQAACDRPGRDAASAGQSRADEAAEQGQANAEQGQANAEQGQANAEQGQANAEQGQANAEQGQANAEGDDLESTDDDPAAEGEANAEEGRANAPTDIPAGERP